MMAVIRQWLDALDVGERDPNSQGYVVVYGAAGSFVVPIGPDTPPPGSAQRHVFSSRTLQQCQLLLLAH
jgi:hypothetical protein